MNDEFDDINNLKNQRKHQVSLSRWSDLEIQTIVEDDRYNYGETRYRAYGLIDDRPHCLVFVVRDGKIRPISLRRAHAKEVRRYAPPKN